jgi:hypothetical protein
MSHTIGGDSDNIFLRLYDAAAGTNSSCCANLKKSDKHKSLKLFLQWLALPRGEQVDDMLPYLRTLAGVEIGAIDLKSIRTHFEGMIPEGAPASARRVFLEIVEGVVMIYLHTRSPDQKM